MAGKTKFNAFRSQNSPYLWDSGSKNGNDILYFLMETYKSLETNLKTMIWDNWHEKLPLKLLIVPSFKMWWKMSLILLEIQNVVSSFYFRTLIEFETLDSYAYLCYEAFEVLVCFLCWEFWYISGRKVV